MSGAGRRVPYNLFGIAFGLAGLAGVWLLMAHEHHAPIAVANVLLGLSTLAWLILLAVYIRYALADRGALRRDLLDPVGSPFASLIVITPMLLGAQGLYPHAATAGRVVVDVFIALTVIFGGWITGQWIYGPLEIDQIHPGFFLPTAAGGFIAGAVAGAVGQQRLGYVVFGLGIISWLLLGSIVLTRLTTRPLPPTPLMPTLAIEVAPAAVASLGWFALHGERIDIVLELLGGYGLLMVLVQLRLLPAYLRLPFMPGTWAFTFSWAGVATTAIHWLNDLHPTGYRAYEYVLVVAITALVCAIAIRTLIAVGHRQLLPASSSPAIPAVPDRQGSLVGRAGAHRLG
ncbi:MAG: family transporter [Mycobacterium sp.]|jgi:tellurite resistance protein|nr:family transporter [Mycobacterium sp.]